MTHVIAEQPKNAHKQTMLSPATAVMLTMMSPTPRPAVTMCATPTTAAAAPTTIAKTTRSVQLVDNLKSGDFQHPDDKRASTLLSSPLLAPVEWGVREAFKNLLEDSVFMENIATGVLVGPTQVPELHKMLVESCKLLSLETAPDLYIRQSPSPNAYTLAIQGRRPFVVVTTALLDLLEPLEIQAVIAHELGHLKCEHSLSIALANLLLSPLSTVSPAVSASLQSSLLRFQRSAELSCDRAALVVVQDVRAVQGVSMKLSGGSARYAKAMDVDAFVQQAATYDEIAEASRMGRMIRQSQQRDATHPLPIYRARELQKYAVSKEYKALLSRGKSIAVGAA